MQAEALVLSAYPLSQSFQSSLNELAGKNYKTATLGDLRSLRPMPLLRALWNMRPDRLLLPLEDENSLALLPVVKLVAGFTRARRIEIVNPDLSITDMSRMGTLVDVVRFAGASVQSAIAAMLSAIELKSLLRSARITVPPPERGCEVLYLKTNLWMGIKAGGSVGHIAGVVNALQDEGYPVTFASAEPPVMVSPKVDLLPVEPPRTFGLPYGLNNYRFQFSFAKVASSAIECHRYGFIYQRLSAANYLGVVLSRRHGLPLVVEYNGSETWIAKNWGREMSFNGLATMAEEAMLRHAHLVVTISDVLRDELILRGVDPARIVTYPNGIDPEIFDPTRFGAAERDALRARYGLSTDDRVCAFIGTFGQWHGADILAQAIAELRTNHADWLTTNRCRFLLIGDGPKAKEVRQIIERANATDICTITGLVPQSEAPLHLAASDCLLSPHVANPDGSKFFGSPTKLFEYMAMEKGIYGSRLDQIAQVLAPSVDIGALPDAAEPSPLERAVAVLGEPGSVTDLVEGVKFLVERRAWAEKLARNARQKALTEYTWKHHVDAILQGMSRALTMER